MSDEIIQKAIEIRDRLVEVRKEIIIHGQMAKSSSAKTLAKMDAATVGDAIALLAKLGTEVERLRLGIGHFHYGRMSANDLYKMTKKWIYPTSR